MPLIDSGVTVSEASVSPCGLTREESRATKHHKAVISCDIRGNRLAGEGKTCWAFLQHRHTIGCGVHPVSDGLDRNPLSREKEMRGEVGDGQNGTTCGSATGAATIVTHQPLAGLPF